MTPVKHCPVCFVNNKSNKLVLRQINFRQAVYLCEDKSCTYPHGHKLVEVEERTLSQLSREKKQQSIDKTDLDAWLENFFAGEEKVQNDQTSDDGIINDDDLSKIIDEITKPPNENDLDLEYDSDLYTWVDSTFEKCSLNESTIDNRNVNKINIEDSSNKAVDNLLTVDEPEKRGLFVQCDDDTCIFDENTIRKSNFNSDMLKNPNSNGNKAIDTAANSIISDISYNDLDLSDKGICSILTRDNMQSVRNPSNNNEISNRTKTLVNDKKLAETSSIKNNISTKPTQYRILNFEQKTPLIIDSNISRTGEQSQTNISHSQYRNTDVLLPPKPKKIILKGSTLSTVQDSSSTSTSGKKNKFKDCRFVNIVIKPPNSQ